MTPGGFTPKPEIRYETLKHIREWSESRNICRCERPVAGPSRFGERRCVKCERVIPATHHKDCPCISCHRALGTI